MPGDRAGPLKKEKLMMISAPSTSGKDLPLIALRDS
jgi:hypothetical protein